MFSGGLDSFGAAWELFTNPEYSEFDIHLHHIHLINREQRTKQEKIATSRFIKFCHGEGISFSYSSNLIGFGFMSRGNFPMDSYVYAFLAGMICNNDPSIAHVAVGRTKTDIDDGIEHARHIIRSQEIFNTSLEDLKRFRVSYIFPAKGLTKTSIYNNLPQYLKESFWSCRKPNNGEPCGVCKTCEKLKELNIPHPILKEESVPDSQAV